MENGVDTNEIDGNKISYTRHYGGGPGGYWDNEGETDSSDEDDCPTCFESIGEGLIHEMGDPGHYRGSSRKHDRKVQAALEKMR